jgi:hypothetical protein
VAEKVLEAIQADTFYIIPAQDYMMTSIQTRFDQIMKQENPTTGLI